MGIFRRNDDGVTDDGVVTDDDVVARDRVVEDRRGDWGGPPLVRALFTLLGVAVAGLLIWLASYFDLTSTTEFWAAMGLIAAAGLALGLSQLFGGWTKWGIPVISPGVFLLAFIPAAVVVGWILLATQPDGGWQQERISGWTDDIGMTGLVNDLGLDLTGWSLLRATAVSGDGNTIVGTGTNASGEQEAWIAIIPEPTTGLLVAVGLAGLAATRRRDLRPV